MLVVVVVVVVVGLLVLVLCPEITSSSLNQTLFGLMLQRAKTEIDIFL